MKLNIKYAAVSPISHNGDEILSTIAPFRRQKINYNGEIIDVPAVSGNSFRGVWRRLGADILMKLLGLEKVKPELYHILFAGGALEGSNEDEQVLFKREIREKIPFLSVFGSAINTFILEGKLSSGFGYVVSKECEQMTDIKSERSIYEFLSTEFYTRREDYEAEKNEVVDGTVQMKYECETLIAGTELQQTLILKSDKDNEIGCFMSILKEWNDNGAVIGGVSRAGHGRVKIEGINFDDYKDQIEGYKKYCIDNAEIIKELLLKL